MQNMPRNELSGQTLEGHSTAVEGELLPPAQSGDQKFQQQWIKLLSIWTDAVFEVPGLGWRFGLDPIIGLVPVVGDVASAAVSLYILSLAAHMQVPRVTLMRMMLNVAVDYLVGAIPFVGNIFDFGWKANYWNAQLLERALASPATERRRQTIWDALLVGGMMAILVVGLIASITAAVWIANWLVSQIGAAF
jgi:hypothetical protein